MDKLLAHLGYTADDIKLKTAIRELKIGHGSGSSLYRPDYVIIVNGFPALIIDAKSPDESVSAWTTQCGSYCLELNRLYEHNPVEYYILTNGLTTSFYKWDRAKPLAELSFDDFQDGNRAFEEFEALISKQTIGRLANAKRDELMESDFVLESVTLEEMSAIFTRLHQFIWETEKKTPSAAFQELMKIVFIKIKKDRELRSKLGPSGVPKVKDVVFSVAWIQNQSESDNPINDPLFKNLLRDLEKEIRDKNKRRIFDPQDNIRLHPNTILRVVREFEHKDFYLMDEDVHGRMFESFLDATVRGPELGQFFTPRDIVKLMVNLADIQVTKGHVETVLDACCGSGGFLISAMSDMLAKAGRIVGLSSKERRQIERVITSESLIGIDAGSDPPIYRIARMNMYLHGDGGSSIFLGDSLDKRIGQVGHSDLEGDDEISVLREMLISKNRKFDVILSNPPFSLKYSRESRGQHDILNQYDLGGRGKHLQSLPSSVMFLERYSELVASTGRVLAIIDDSILSGESYSAVRDFIRETFIVIGVVSLPGDAFRRADARVKTSILILRVRHGDEEQPDVFMEKAVYLGLTAKTAKRLGIPRTELEREKPRETERIVAQFRQFLSGVGGDYVVSRNNLVDRLDVKHCVRDTGRRKSHWLAKGVSVGPLHTCLTEATKRDIEVQDGTEYSLLKVTYDGEVVEAEKKFGDDISYRTLYQVKEWDVLFSNINVGRGAIGIVPRHCDGLYVSNEYTILVAKSKADALYYSSILRTKEILGDILSSTTGMGRGRLRWEDMRNIDVPIRGKQHAGIDVAVKSLESLWDAHADFKSVSMKRVTELTSELKLEGDDSRVRWLAFKAPE